MSSPNLDSAGRSIVAEYPRDRCRMLAGPLPEAGIAALIYDKQGHSRSGGQAEPTIFDQADAACGTLDLLAATQGLDPSRLGLLGFSNGMWAAPMAAARRPDSVSFLAGVGSPGVTMAESEVHRRTKVLRDAGVSERTLRTIAIAWRCIFRIAAAGQASLEVASDLKAALAQLSHAPSSTTGGCAARSSCSTARRTRASR